MGKLTDHEKIILVEDFKNGVDINNLSEKYRLTKSSVRGLLKRRGIEIKNNKQKWRKYTINEKFFDMLNEESLYVLGLLYADGYHNEKRKSIRISLKENDMEILLKINNLIGSNRPIGTDSSKGQDFKQVFLDINSTHISKRLVELGCIQNKTFKIKFPNFIPKELLRHFIRGYFDGDGGLTNYITNKNHKKTKLTFRGTFDFCFNLKIFLNEELDVGGYISKDKIPSLEYSGKQQLIKIMEYLYQNSTIYLERKFNKYKTIRDE